MRTSAGLSGIGAAIGAAIALVLHFATWTSGPATFGWTGFTPPPRRYVDYLPVSGSGAYQSVLSLHFDGTAGGHPGWWPLVPVAAGLGAILGALVGLVLVRVGVRLSRRTSTPPAA